MTGSLIFSPLLPWHLLIALAVIAALGCAVALWRGMAGWALRALAALVILAGLSGPSWLREDRSPLTDIVLLVEDRSASQRLGDRADQTAQAAQTLATRLAARPNTEVRRITVADGQDNAGTQAMTAIADALAEEPRARIAGIILLSDGRLHDLDTAPDLPAPLHLLLTGTPQDWDRRLILKNAPAFGILGEEVTLTIRIEDDGNAPARPNGPAGRVPLIISVDGGPDQSFAVDVGRDINLPIVLPHGGRNVIQFSTPEQPGELTARNNTAIAQINGVRDRLRVLLVSGEPHAGGRTWRNLLKSDSSVDLVHFTILRPPAKQDGVPVSELSLIAFPTRELFLEKVDDFDLIIFDRYKRRGILPAIYLDNVRAYVERGGTVLIAAGPDFASADSIYRSPLGEIFPARPTARVIEEGYRPKLTDLGRKHPVTAGLDTAWDGEWGRWMRQIEVTQIDEDRGHVVMTGVDDKPLLILDRVGEGRVALLASDHAWLWNRGYEGGGPQLELLRRLAHWMMKEPELEEEALTAQVTGQTIEITRRTLGEGASTVTITRPDGTDEALPLTETAPGVMSGSYTGPDIGLYRLTDGELTSVVGLGPAAPREFEQTIADGRDAAPLIAPLRGGIVTLSNGVPTIREVRPGRPAAGRGWIGITPRDAFETRNVTQMPILPEWLVLLLASALILAGWLREGRR